MNNSGICRECKLLVHNLLDIELAERWSQAVGLDDHIVSDMGRVARLLKVDRAHRYPRISAEGRKFYVHHLVAESFHGERPDGQLARHLDDVPENCTAENLAWGSQADNAADARRNRARTSAGETGQEKEKS